ncbi:MAG: hypothetical protein PHD48_06350 [Alphaproteobacteria bacterium]|nr:hypothetical protein [Alphaproteobacteria bacterium]
MFPKLTVGPTLVGRTVSGLAILDDGSGTVVIVSGGKWIDNDTISLAELGDGTALSPARIKALGVPPFTLELVGQHLLLRV